MSGISHAQHPISTLSLALFADSKPHFPLLLILVLSRLLEPTALPAEAHVGRGAGSPASTSVPWSMHHSLGRARVRARNGHTAPLVVYYLLLDLTWLLISRNVSSHPLLASALEPAAAAVPMAPPTAQRAGAGRGPRHLHGVSTPGMPPACSTAITWR